MDEYFTEQLKNGQEFKICFMIHNAYWSSLDKLSNYHENCQIDCYGSGLAYFKIRHSDFNLKQDYDYDLIIIDSSRKGIDVDEFLAIKQLATRISKEKHKKITVGYAYFLPNEKRINDGTTHTHVMINSFYDGEEILIKDIPYLDDSPYVLLDIISKEYNDMPIEINNFDSVQINEKKFNKKL